MVLHFCEYTKNQWIVYFNRVNVMLYESDLKKAVIKKLPIGESMNEKKFKPVSLSSHTQFVLIRIKR